MQTFKELKENELHSISGDEMKSKSTATTFHGRDQIMHVNLNNGQKPIHIYRSSKTQSSCENQSQVLKRNSHIE